MLLSGTDYNFYPDSGASDTIVSAGFEAPVQQDVSASAGEYGSE
jgi:hypothetical protein